MKISFDGNTVISNIDTSNAVKFSIAVNSKAFKLFSSTLYSDKIGSIVREISCNAYDAHVAAGKEDEPFQVHIPDKFEPWFAVKDFGIGLSKDQVFKIFSTYLASTKDDSNSMVGAFGLGSKSPFSYTDNFMLISNYDGVKTVYSCFIGEDGQPYVVDINSMPTDECNGVEVRIAVAPEDYEKFSNAVSTQLAAFKVKPTLINTNDNFSFWQFLPNSQPIFEESGKFAVYNSTPVIYFIQGNVLYKFSYYKKELINLLTDKAKLFFTDANVNLCLVYHVNIGDIGVTISRESIEYDNRTIENIAKFLNEVADKLFNHIKDKLDNIITVGDCKKVVIDYFYKMSGHPSYFWDKFCQFIGGKENYLLNKKFNQTEVDFINNFTPFREVSLISKNIIAGLKDEVVMITTRVPCRQKGYMVDNVFVFSDITKEMYSPCYLTFYKYPGVEYKRINAILINDISNEKNKIVRNHLLGRKIPGSSNFIEFSINIDKKDRTRLKNISDKIINILENLGISRNIIHISSEIYDSLGIKPVKEKKDKTATPEKKKTGEVKYFVAYFTDSAMCRINKLAAERGRNLSSINSDCLYYVIDNDDKFKYKEVKSIMDEMNNKGLFYSKYDFDIVFRLKELKFYTNVFEFPESNIPTCLIFIHKDDVDKVKNLPNFHDINDYTKNVINNVVKKSTFRDMFYFYKLNQIVEEFNIFNHHDSDYVKPVIEQMRKNVSLNKDKNLMRFLKIVERKLNKKYYYKAMKEIRLIFYSEKMDKYFTKSYIKFKKILDGSFSKQNVHSYLDKIKMKYPMTYIYVKTFNDYHFNKNQMIELTNRELSTP